ncbi:MAG: hypothetical protein U0792_24740 [Gemmataceae bacterium]
MGCVRCLGNTKSKRLVDGIPVPDGTWELITKTAAELKVALPK